jgi:trafficking protein particle complex subunit 9
MFSPLAFPRGMLLYELTTTSPTHLQLSMAPFELFRQPLLVVGIGDASEFASEHHDLSEPREKDLFADFTSLESGTGFSEIITQLREQYSKALVHRLFVFNHLAEMTVQDTPKEVTFIPAAPNLKTTSIKTVMCDLTSVLLAEMTTLAKSFQALPTISSPGSVRTSATDENYNLYRGQRDLHEKDGLQNQQDLENTPQTVDISTHRMSMPTQLPSTASDFPHQSEPRPQTPQMETRPSPATNFDDMPGLAAMGNLPRSHSSASQIRNKPTTPNYSSQDKVSVYGFGSGSVSERVRNRGKSRVGIMVGVLYMCTGRWSDALKELSEQATNARNLSDHLWHGKALECILVCLLLMAWAGLDFQVCVLFINGTR